MKNLFLALLLCALPAVPACAQGSRLLAIEKAEGKRYLRALAAEIRRADRIVITEHSFDYDAYDGKLHKSLLPEQVIYAQRELTENERAAFAISIDRVVMRPRTVIANCLPEPHHTLTFYHAGAQSSVLDACFGCGASKWSLQQSEPPATLTAALSAIVSSAGLQPHRDWKALARSQLDSGDLKQGRTAAP